MTKFRWFLLIMLIGVLLRVHFISHFDIRVDKALPDEVSHWNYIQYIHHQHELPSVAWVFSDSSALPEPFSTMYTGINKSKLYSYEFFQPPAYYIWQGLLGFDDGNVVRAWNVAFFVLGMVLLWKCSENFYAVGLISLSPGGVEWLTRISNDAGIFLAACVLVYGLAKNKIWIYALGITLAATTKMQGGFISGSLLLWFMWHRNWKWSVIALGGVLLSLYIFIDRWDMMVVNKMDIIPIPNSITLYLYDTVNNTILTAFLPQWIPIYSADAVRFCWVVPLIMALVYFSLRHKTYSKFTFAAAGCIPLWVAFQATHDFYEGRLLLPAIPFLAANYYESTKNKKV